MNRFGFSTIKPWTNALPNLDPHHPVVAGILAVVVTACATAPVAPPSVETAERASPIEMIAPVVPPAAAAPISLSYWQQREDLLDIPVAPQPAVWTWPQETTFTLPNGLVTHLLSKRDEALTTVALTLPAGEYAEPLASRGAAALLAGWLRTGSSRRNGQPLELRVEELGAVLDIDADRGNLVITCSSMQPTLAGCVQLLADVAQSPAFEPKALLAVRAQLAAHRRQVLASSQGRGYAHLSNLLFGDEHPAGRALLPDHVGTLDQAKVRQFWSSWFRPNLAHLVVAGNVERPQLQRAVTKAFGAWARGPIPKLPLPRPPAQQGLRVLLLDDPAATEATILFGQHLTVRDAQERAALEALVFILGGAGTGSRLALDVAARGLLSAGGVALEAVGRSQFVLRGTLQSHPSQVWQALLAAAQQQKDLAEQGLTVPELMEAKARSAAFDPFALETAAGLAAAVARSRETSVREFSTIAAEVSRLDAKALKRAGKALSPEHLTVVIVGPAMQIAPELQRAKVRFEQVGFEDPISVTERAQRKQLAADAENPTLRASGPELLAAKTLIIKALAAQGGAPSWRALKTLKLVKQGQRREGAGVAKMISTTYYQRPDKVRVEQVGSVAGNPVKAVFLVTADAVRGGDDSKPLQTLPEDNVQRLRDAVFEDVTFLLLNILDARPPLPMQLAAPLQEGDTSYDGVLLRVPSGQWLKLYFDPHTHLLARIRSPDDAGGESEQRLSDWRVIEGLKFPFKQVSVGVNASEASVEDVQVNKPLDPALFR